MAWPLTSSRNNPSSRILNSQLKGRLHNCFTLIQYVRNLYLGENCYFFMKSVYKYLYLIIETAKCKLHCPPVQYHSHFARALLRAGDDQRWMKSSLTWHFNPNFHIFDNLPSQREIRKRWQLTRAYDLWRMNAKDQRRFGNAPHSFAALMKVRCIPS